MKKITVKTKLCPDGFVEKLDDQKAELFVAESIQYDSWGKPERWVLHKDEPFAESYDEADVLEEKVEEVPHSVVASEDGESQIVQTQKWVKLKAEYTVEIEDITAQHELEQVIAKRKAEYPSAEEFLNAYFDGGQAALDALQAARLAVKAKYPKP